MVQPNLPREVLDNIMRHCSRLLLRKLRLCDPKRGALHNAASGQLFKEFDFREEYCIDQPDLSTCPQSVSRFVQCLGIEFFAFTTHGYYEPEQELQALAAAPLFPNLKRINISIDCRRPDGYEEEAGNDDLPAIPSEAHEYILETFSRLKRLVEGSSLLLEISINMADTWSLGCLQIAMESGCSPDILNLMPNCGDCSMGQLDEVEQKDSFVPKAKWAPRELEIDTSADVAFLASLVDHRNLKKLGFGSDVQQYRISDIPWLSSCLENLQYLSMGPNTNRQLDSSAAHLLQSATFRKLRELDFEWSRPSLLSLVNAPTLQSMCITVYSVTHLIEALQDILKKDLPMLNYMQIHLLQPADEVVPAGHLAEHMGEILPALQLRKIVLDVHLDWNTYTPSYGQNSVPVEALVRCLAPVLVSLDLHIRATATPQLSSINPVALTRLETMDFSCEGGESTAWIFDFLGILSAPSLIFMRYSFIRKGVQAECSAFFAGMRAVLESAAFPSLLDCTGDIIKLKTRMEPGLFKMCASFRDLKSRYGIAGVDTFK